MKVWSNGKIFDKNVEIDSMNYTLHYASPCVWEGMRSYVQPDGSAKIYRLKQHIQRLFDSAKILNFKIPYTLDEVIKACEDLIKVSNSKDLYFRPIAYCTNKAESAKPQNPKISLDIYCFPLKPLHNSDGIDCIISSYRRGYPMYQMQAKTPKNYDIMNLVKEELDRSGANDALLQDNDGYIVEATVANLFVVKNKVVMTPPNDGSILPGITRQSLAEIISSPNLRKHGYQIFEKRITRADLYTADCVMMCGTYAEVVKINTIDGRDVSEDDHCFKLLKDEYYKKVRGL